MYDRAMPGEVVNGFWVAVLHVVGGLLLYPKGSRAKEKDRVTEYQVKTPAITNDDRLVFRRAAHIEWRDQEAEAA